MEDELLQSQGSRSQKQVLMLHAVEVSGPGLAVTTTQSRSTFEAGLSEPSLDAVVIGEALDPDLSLVGTVRAARADLPVIVLTMKEDIEVGVAGLSGGADEFFAEARLDPHLLIRAISTATNRRNRVQGRPKERTEPARKRVLLIEDEAINRRALAMSLSKRHDIVEAEDGKTAIALLGADGDFDAIICDLMMPIVDGQTVLETLEDRHPALVQRFMVMTGGAITDRAEAFVRRDGVHVVQKPIRPRDLLAELDNILDATA